jgi:C4-dicarboxylate-specific signal transduction histidine kinase
MVINLQCNEKIKTYPNEIKHVILNLIKNAQDVLLETNTKNPIISISSQCDENDMYQIVIKDNGGGVPVDIQDKIFDPYFSTKQQKDGTGLGLYMSKIIVQEHCNGTLEVKNDDEGAIFTIKVKNG